MTTEQDEMGSRILWSKILYGAHRLVHSIGRVGRNIGPVALVVLSTCNGTGPREPIEEFEAVPTTAASPLGAEQQTDRSFGSGIIRKGDPNQMRAPSPNQSNVGMVPRLPPPATLKPGTRLTRGTTIHVGPDRLYRKPSAAANIAKDGDTVEIDAAEYFGDVAVWSQNDLTLRGVGGRPHLRGAGRSAEGKAIWVIKGDNTTVENVEFSGAKVADKNGAGIRLEGASLMVRNSSFHDNEMGILTGRNSKSEVTIENSEFYGNTVDYQKYGRLGHNIYIGEIRKFTLIGSYVHDAIIGHNVKSRAHYNVIKYNRIMDEQTGGSSYLVDLPNGGAAYLLGNSFRQSARNDNWAMISYGSEGHKYEDRTIHVVNNTFVNDDTKGVFVQILGNARAKIVNNLFVGRGEILWSKDDLLEDAVFAGNVITTNPNFISREAFDYRLEPGSPAVDQGAHIASVQGIDLIPTEIYSHPVRVAPRKQNGALDAGAYELEYE